MPARSPACSGIWTCSPQTTKPAAVGRGPAAPYVHSMPVKPKEKSFRRTHLGWLHELAIRRRDVVAWRRFGEEATEMALEEFARRGKTLVAEHDARREEVLDWNWMARTERLRYRLLIERDLNTRLREYSEEPKGHGQFEFELHWTRWAISNLVEWLRGDVYRAEDGIDVRASWQGISAEQFADFDKAWPLLETATEDELHQAVHKAAGRTSLS
jgi:hypothetical protein